jgi:hypothetical protein
MENFLAMFPNFHDCQIYGVLGEPKNAGGGPNANAFRGMAYYPTHPRHG